MKPNPIYQHFLLVILLFTITAGKAEIYQWQDQEGNIIFSNSPPTDGGHETITSTETMNVITQTPKKVESSPKTKNPIKHTDTSDTAKKTQAPPKTLANTITSPANNTHIHTFNPLIPIATSPALSPKAKVIVFANDKAANAVYQNDTWNMPRPPPGENKISLHGTTASGEPFSSNTITIYIHNTHVRRK